MQVFTFCEENYTKRTRAHPALSEMEQHEWDDLGTSEGFNQAAWASEENIGYTFTSLMKHILWLHRQMLINFVFTPPTGMANDRQGINCGGADPFRTVSWLVSCTFYIFYLYFGPTKLPLVENTS